jgi:catechol 2,3-dioxygenase-like lactoylglutathione lyase family enzyme
MVGMSRPRMQITSVVLGAADPRALAGIYQRRLGWSIVADEPPRPGFPPRDGWLMLRPPPGGPGGLQCLSSQREPDYEPPVWPPVLGHQQMMLHLDIAADDVDASVAWSQEAGASLAEHQPQEDVRVMLDPAGHPFCFFPAPLDARD